MIFIKLKGGALQLTLFIIVVIALLLAAFVLIINVHDRFEVQTQFVKKTIENSNQGIRYAINNDFKTITLKSDDNDYSKTMLSKTNWGIFEKVISTSILKTNQINKIALLGAKQPEFKRSALYIEENNKPLVVVGNTRIKGLTYLPKRGIKAGTIAGQSYYGSQLIYGNTAQSSDLPELNNSILIYLKQLKKIGSGIPQDAFLSINRTKKYQNSFLKPTKFIISNGVINLSEAQLIGNIVVKSKTKIYVSDSSQLNDVLLIAPEVIIKSNVKGAFQAIASKKITVEPHVTLEYPSALVLLSDQQGEISSNLAKQDPLITIGRNSKIKGSIVSITPKTVTNFKPQIFIDTNSTIMGEVYCNENIELLGTVKGSVFTANFVANQKGSIYQNHLYNATIDISALNSNYSGLLFENSKKSVAKWLY